MPLSRFWQKIFRNRYRRPIRNTFRPIVEELESRLAPAVLSDGGTTTLTIALGAGEQLGITANPGTYIFTSSNSIFAPTNGTNPANQGTAFSAFGNNALALTAAGISQYTTIDITDTGGTGASVVFNDSGTFTYLNNFTIDLHNSPAIPGLTFNGTSSFLAHNIDANVDSSIVVNSGGKLSTIGGAITLDANQGMTSTSGDFSGVEVNNATITSANGSIQLKGKGGDSGTVNYGVYIHNGAVVSSTQSAPITITGNGGGGSGDTVGVDIQNANTKITTTNGAVTITGTGGSSGDCGGVEFYFGAVVRSTGNSAGNVTVMGYGGTSGGGGAGIFLQTGSIYSVSGAIQLTGTGSAHTDRGVVLAIGSHVISTGTGASAATIDITGTGGTTAGGDLGVSINDSGTQVASVDGAIQITGTGGAGGGSDDGVLVLGGAQVSSTGSATITITGTAGDSSSTAVDLVGDMSDPTTQVTSSGTGNVTLVGNSINIDTSYALVNAASNRVFLQPKSAGTKIDVGLGTTAGDLNLTSAELNRITAGILAIGDFGALTAAITVTAPITAPAGWSTLELLVNTSSPPSTVTQTSGSSITVANLVAQANGGVTLTDPGNKVTTLAGISGAHPFNFVNSTDLTVGNIDTFSGIQTFGGGSVAVTALGTGSLLTVGSPIDTSPTGKTAADVTLSADSMAITAAINAPGHTATLQQGGTTTRNIVLGGNTAGNLAISNAALGQITANVVKIGRTDNAGSISIAAAISAHAGYSILHLLTGAGITQTASLTVSKLAVDAADAVSLVNSANSVGTLAANETSGNFRFMNSGSLTIGTVDGITGITNTKGSVTVTTTAGANNITVAANVTSGTNPLDLTAGQDIDLTASVILTGKPVTFNGAVLGGGNYLTVTGNAVFNNSVKTVGNLSVTGTAVITADIGTTQGQLYSGPVTLEANATIASTSNGNIIFGSTLDSPGTAYSLTINPTNGVTFTGAVGSIGALKSLAVNSGGKTIAIDGGSVDTTGAQTYSDDVILGGDTTLTATTATFNAGLTLGSTAATATSTLQITGSLQFASTTTLTTTFTGTGSAQFGHITVSGNTIYSNATLALSYAGGFSPGPGNHFDIVSNGTTGTGHFVNAPPPGPDTINGTIYYVTYTGGGDDFILTVPASANFGPWGSLGGGVQQLATGTDPNGDLELFGIGLPTITSRSGGGPPPGAALYVNVQSTPNGGYSGWQPLGGYVTQITVGTEADGTLVVFGIGGDNAAWFRQQQNNSGNLSWTQWQSLGGYVKQLAVGTDPNGNLELFGIGGDNAVWYDVQKGNNASTFGGWNSLGGYVTQITVANNQSATPTQKGTLTVYGIGGDHAAWFRQQESAGNLTFSNWASLGGYVKQLTAGLDAQGNLELFGIGGDNAAWVNVQGGADTFTYGGWNSLGGYVTQLVVGQNSDGTLELVGIGGDHAAWVKKQTSPAGPAFDAFWTSLGGYVKQLALGTNQDLALSLFGIGADNAAWLSTQE